MRGARVTAARTCQSRTRYGQQVTPRQAVAVPALVAYGWWATSLRPFSVAATVFVVGAGALAICLGLRHPLPRDERPRQRGVAGWAVLTVALVSWQLAAYLQDPRSDHPTLSSLANGVLESHPVRAFSFVAWIGLAVVLAKR